MKRLVVFGLVSMMVLTGCASRSSGSASATSPPSSETRVATSEVSSAETTVATSEPIVEEVTEEALMPEIQAPEFVIKSYQVTDKDGYDFEVTVRFSPWMLLSANKDLIGAAWAEVGMGQYLVPRFEDWGLEKDPMGVGKLYRQVDPGGYFEHSMTDMYYCVGQLDISNITQDWPITSSNGRELRIGVYWYQGPSERYYQTISRFFYPSGYSDRGGVNDRGISMSLNEASIPFLIMAPELFSPNYPEGENVSLMTEGHFRVLFSNGFWTENLVDDDIRVEVIGK